MASATTIRIAATANVIFIPVAMALGSAVVMPIAVDIFSSNRLRDGEICATRRLVALARRPPALRQSSPADAASCRAHPNFLIRL